MFSGEDSNRILVKSGNYTPVYNGRIVQYTGTYLGKSVPCIGEVKCPRIIDSEVCGIYVMPQKIFTDAWYHFKVGILPYRHFYPELLQGSVLDTVGYPEDVECVGTIEYDPLSPL